MRNRATLLCLSLVATACGGLSPEEKAHRTMEVALSTGASIGYAASLAIQAMNGAVTCAAAATACSTSPCDVDVNVTLGASCPLPLGGTGSGTIVVDGNWSSSTGTVSSGTVGMNFGTAQVGSEQLVVTQSTGIIVSKDGDLVDVTYFGQNVQVEDANDVALADQSSWQVEVNTFGTTDPADDSYTITGFQQSVGTTGSNQVAQIVLSNVVITDDCRLNPVDGSATIQAVGGTSVSQQMLQFHDTCDGKAERLGLFGFQTVDLNFTR